MSQETLFVPLIEEPGGIPRISTLDPKFREPRTEAEMIPARLAEIAAHKAPRCPSSKGHGLTVARDPRKQTYEQLWCGIWFGCQKCAGSVSWASRELAHYHGHPYTDGTQWWKYAGGTWVPIAEDEASAFWDRLLAWQNARRQESLRLARKGKRSRRGRTA